MPSEGLSKARKQLILRRSGLFRLYPKLECNNLKSCSLLILYLPVYFVSEIKLICMVLFSNSLLILEIWNIFYFTKVPKLDSFRVKLVIFRVKKVVLDVCYDRNSSLISYVKDTHKQPGRIDSSLYFHKR